MQPDYSWPIRVGLISLVLMRNRLTIYCFKNLRNAQTLRELHKPHTPLELWSWYECYVIGDVRQDRAILHRGHVSIAGFLEESRKELH